MVNPLPAPVPQAAPRFSEPPPPTGTGRPRRVLSREQVAELLRAPQGRHKLRDEAIVSFLYSTACRVSEASAASCGLLELARGAVHLSRPKVRDVHTVPLGCAAHRVERYLAHRRLTGTPPRSDAPLFVSQKGGAISPRTIQDLLVKLGGWCGFERELCHPHILRRSRATHLIEGGLPLVYVQRLLGHRRITTTTEYVYLAMGRYDEEALQLDL